MNTKIISVPLTVGSQYDCYEKSGEILSKTLLKEHKFDYCEINVDNTRTNHPHHAKNVNNVNDCCFKLKNEVLDTLKSAKFPLVIGGDHSISIGTISATSEFFGQDTSYIMLGAYADINTNATSETGNINGMTLAVSLGLCSEDFYKLDTEPERIYGNNIFNIGCRSIDSIEYEIINEYGMSVYSIKDIKEQGLDAVLNHLKSSIKSKKIHLSFDCGVLDSSVFSSYDNLSNNGVSFEDVLKVLKFLNDNFEIVLFECVEFNADKDPKNLKTIFEILNYFAKIKNL